MNQTYYEVLGVSQTASFDEIKRAFRVKAKECHPDYHPNDKEAEKQFKLLNEAYEVLKDGQKRAAYDRYGHDAYTSGMAGGNSGRFHNFDFGDGGFENIFEEVFNVFGNTRRPKHTDVHRGEDIRADLDITFEDAYFGGKKKVVVETYVKCDKCDGHGGQDLITCPTCNGQGSIRQSNGFFTLETECPVCHGAGKTVKTPCDKCQGTGRLKNRRTLELNVPRGVDTGVRMRLVGEGNASLNGLGMPGDLYVFLHMKEHAIFKRDMTDLYCEIPIPMTLAALGGDVVVPTMDGKGTSVHIDAGMQTGEEYRIKGKGMPKLHSDTFGDLYVVFRVETPIKLTPKQRELLEEFDKVGGHTQQACNDFWSCVRKVWKNWTGQS